MSRPRRLAAVFLLACAVVLPVRSEDPAPELPADLAPRFRDWFKRVEMLLTDEEREYFLGLDEDFRRSAFIAAFWAQRDPYEDTEYNEFRVNYEERVDDALADFETLKDARSQTWVLQGEPHSRCWKPNREVEIWIYDEGSEFKALRSYDDLFPVLLYRPLGSEYYLRWLPPAAKAKPGESVAPFSWFMPAIRRGLPDVAPISWCGDGDVASAMARIEKRVNSRGDGDPHTLATLETPEPSKEWVAAFHSQTTILPADATTFPAELTFAFPGRHQQRTVVQGVLEIERRELAAFERHGQGQHQFLLLGEVVRDDELFERFRYRFEVPGRPAGEPLALVFQRYLRPGPFRLLFKLEDLFGRRYAHLDRTIEVPDVAAKGPPGLTAPLRKDSELYRALSEADAATARGERSLQLLSPSEVVVTGLVRFRTVTAGEFERVVFLLDEQPILSKRTPPYSVELDLGDVPSAHRLRVNGYGPGDEILASDEILLNPGGQRFRVSLTEPQRGRRYRGSLRAAVQVAVPDGETLDRIELFLNEARVATLYQPPFVQPILLGDEQLAYVRAVGFLADGNASEDLVFVNAPGEIDEIHVHFVELYAAVYDRQGRFIPDLAEDDFQVFEDGERQTARRFEWVESLPLHAALVIDVSASMEDSIKEVAAAAQSFVEQVVEPRDRAALVAFDHQPHVLVRFTNDVATLSRELEGLRTFGGTALYDTLAFALHYFHGIKGQKALLLLSDGEDESSGFDFDDALEFARRAGVQIYVIGLKEAVTKHGARKVLKQFADQTGGRAFFVDDLAALPGIYGEIQADLRSQYLFAYQSTSQKDPSEFRTIEVVVKVGGRKAEVRAMRGYYP